MSTIDAVKENLEKAIARASAIQQKSLANYANLKDFDIERDLGLFVSKFLNDYVSTNNKEYVKYIQSFKDNVMVFSSYYINLGTEVLQKLKSANRLNQDMQVFYVLKAKYICKKLAEYANNQCMVYGTYNAMQHHIKGVEPNKHFELVALRTMYADDIQHNITTSNNKKSRLSLGSNDWKEYKKLYLQGQLTSYKDENSVEFLFKAIEAYYVEWSVDRMKWTLTLLSGGLTTETKIKLVMDYLEMKQNLNSYIQLNNKEVVIELSIYMKNRLSALTKTEFA